MPKFVSCEVESPKVTCFWLGTRRLAPVVIAATAKSRSIGAEDQPRDGGGLLRDDEIEAPGTAFVATHGGPALAANARKFGHTDEGSSMVSQRGAAQANSRPDGVRLIKLIGS